MIDVRENPGGSITDHLLTAPDAAGPRDHGSARRRTGLSARSQGLYLLAQTDRRPVQSKQRQQRRDLQPCDQDAQARATGRRSDSGGRHQHRRHHHPRCGDFAPADARLVHHQRRRGHGKAWRGAALCHLAGAGPASHRTRRAASQGNRGFASGRASLASAAATETAQGDGTKGAVTTRISIAWFCLAIAGFSASAQREIKTGPNR